MTDTNSATRVIDASANDIFALLSDPSRHAETDNSGMVVSADTDAKLEKVGDIFVMNMTKEDGDYQTRNEVFAFQENKVIGWQNLKNLTADVEVGAKWLYELASEGNDRTSVTLTYDRSEIESDAVRKMSENFDDAAMEESLAALASALDGTDNPTQKS
ncbi:SRPBCC domain-containing protein [Corynebacterium urinipleomorphum]|uniref:SRPBCC domain-containing protein n=1 Tax=Corynebacterium urinipleomorphum TaxID=1852380 RepID=UPI000B360D5D|nr:SRPBCC domain-containing protein [Corynebacterium urinipleomorphum]